MENVAEFCENAIERRVFPGCVVGIIAGGKQWCKAFGHFTYEAGAAEVREESIYDVASITKAVPAATVALLLIDQGRLRPDDRLIDSVPEFTGSYRESITLLHLLTHTLDFGFQLSAFKELPGAVLMEKILSAPLRSAPGTTFSYANATSILLGLVVERITGLALDAAAEHYLFTPLGMRRTTFHPERFPLGEVAPAEFDPWRGRVVHAEVHDESAFALRPKVVGSAGLFSTVPDLLRFVEMIPAGGNSENKTILKPETVALMGTDICPQEAGACTGAGWELNQPVFMGAGCRRNTFGKTGFTGCSMVIDTERHAGIVLLSNHVYPERHRDRSVINELRRGVADIVFDTIAASQSGG